MTKFLIFLFPALIDMVLGLTFFVAAVRIAESGAGPIAVTAVVTAWAVVYIFASQWAGRMTTPENSARRIISGCGALALGCLLFITVPHLGATYPLMMLMAIGTAFFFPPFQVFMKAVDQGDGDVLPRSVGLYTFSWSSGMAAGPFVSAFVWTRYGWQACYGLGVALAAMTAVGVLFLKHHAEGDSSSVHRKSPRRSKSRLVVDYSAMPDLAWLGWVCSGVGCITVALLRSYLPSSATVVGISRVQQGILLALISGSQALTGLVLCRSRIWMYEAWPISIFGACGVAGLVAFSVYGEFLPLVAASVCFGVYSGSLFFYLVFHSLVHPEHSTRYVAVHESVVGLTAVLGPLLAGFLAAGISLSAPYFAAALLVLLAVAFQAFVTRRLARSES